MSKRDYKSYQVLAEELQETLQEEVEEIGQSKAVQEEESNLLQDSITRDHMVKEIDKTKETTYDDQVKDKKQGIKAFLNFNLDWRKKEQELDNQYKEILKEQQRFQAKDNLKKRKVRDYKSYYESKERSAVFKSLMTLAKIIITLMLLPFIGVIAFGVMCVIGTVLLVILGAIGIGLLILICICFMATQLSTSLIALGISASITCIAFGGMIGILFLATTKWMIGIIKKYRKPQKKLNGEAAQ